ncbi:CMT1A duplicated region transcript 4 protein isoform X2 [Equus przewalskii]|uniref:CMT1A duplicated region transcript 4 protein isoform X2 n=1 Tax=Equus przewalskii TaxID=9798 RepID=A0ABM4JUC5_EQUPR|nr:PREDICTED: CMT1A duplicated region transcript 4 protein isoform X2 [Equus przewalskii]
MSCVKDLRELVDRRSEDKRRSERGIWTSNVRGSLKMERIDARKKKKEEELTENIGLPLNLLEKHNPWPAYVTYASPVVKKLIEKSKARELECMQALEESRRTLRQNKPLSVIQLKRKKSSKSSGNMLFKDTRSETMLSVWGTCSVSPMGPTVIPEPTHVHTDSRDSPTANYNKIIFARKPMMRMLPYGSLLVSKEKHPNV